MQVTSELMKSLNEHFSWNKARMSCVMAKRNVPFLVGPNYLLLKARYPRWGVTAILRQDRWAGQIPLC